MCRQHEDHQRFAWNFFFELNLRETSMRVINVNQIWQKKNPVRQRNRVARGIRKRINSTFLHSDGPQRAHPPKELSYNFNETKDPLGGKKFMYETKSAWTYCSGSPLMQEEREKVFMTRIWVLVRKGMEPQKHKQLEGVIAHEKVSCLRTSVSLFGHPADQPHKELHRVHFSQSDCAPFVR